MSNVELTHTDAHAAIKADHENDERSFDGMEVEDWLMKQHAKTPDTTCSDDQLEDEEGAEAILLGRAKPGASDWSCLLVHDDTKANGKEQTSSVYPKEEETMTSTVGAVVPTSVDVSRPPASVLPITRRTELLLSPGVILDAESTALASYHNFVVAEMSPHEDDQALVIEGVKTVDPRRRRILILLFTLFVAFFVAVAPFMITRAITSSNISPAGDGGEPQDPQNMTASITSRGGNLSVTIGDAWTSFSPGGIENFIVLNGALDLFQKLVSQTDKTFTFFSASKQADVMGGVDLTFITKALSPMYNGHVVSKVHLNC
jgi:hypothetical protein